MVRYLSAGHLLLESNSVYNYLMYHNMKRSIYSLAVLISTFLIFAACKDFFNEKQSGQILPDKHYQSETDAYNSYLGCFTTLYETMPKYIITSSLLGDLADVTENAGSDLVDINLHKPSKYNTYIDASGFYKLIISVNEALKYLAEIQEKDIDFTDIVYRTYYNIFLGLRTWAYLTLVRLYGEAAYIPDNMSKLPEDFIYLDREIMVDTLINQLDSAISRAYELRGETNYLYALIGELLLEKGYYTEAADALYYSMLGVEFPYVSNSYEEESWINIFISSETQGGEVLTAVPYSRDNKNENQLYYWTSYQLDYLVKPSSVIIDLYSKQIAQNDQQTGDVYRGPGVTYDVVNGNNVINKYLIDAAVPASSDIIMQRVSDLHLLLAEALNLAGNHTDALDLVNANNSEFDLYWRNGRGIRERVYLKSYEIPAGITDSITYIEDIIMEERAMELAYEGKRWFDLMRVARRRGNDYLANKIAAKFSDPAVADEVRNLLLNEENWYLPFDK
jgi:hypothetical protein